MNGYNTPFLDSIATLTSEKTTRFFVPGHKGNKGAIPFLEDILKWDLTEIEGADNLQNPKHALLQSQNNMAAVYGAGATLYSAGGSTSCIQAMLALYVKEKEKVVMARNCHVSAVRALAFLDAQPVWVYPDEKGISPQEAEKALRESGAKALYITSPSYYGEICDIKALSEICKKMEVKLLIDNAHGAHLVLFGMHPIQLGADAVAESLHKTFPALTPAAQLHLKSKEDEPKARQMLNLFTSTSPAYPVLCSIDWCAGLLTQKTDIVGKYKKAAQELLQIQQSNKEITLPMQDPCKLTIYPANAGYTTKQVAQALSANGIEQELCTNSHIVLMATGYNQKEDFAKLSEVLTSFTPKEKLREEEIQYHQPKSTKGIRKALFGAKRTIETEKAEGYTAAELIAPCPPGIPVLVPGEIMSKETVKSLLKSGIFTVEVVL